MNKEILLSKAKRMDNKEWIEGFYFCMSHNDERTHIHHFIIPIGTDLSKRLPIDEILVEIDPETVCQYIGVNDTNGKKIFTGYILKRDIYEETIIGEVVWKTIGGAGFFLKVIRLDGCIQYYPIGSGKYDDDEGQDCDDLILGNVFDNPELLDTRPTAMRMKGRKHK